MQSVSSFLILITLFAGPKIQFEVLCTRVPTENVPGSNAGHPFLPPTTNEKVSVGTPGIGEGNTDSKI